MKGISEYAVTRRQSGRLNIALWVAQVVLALLFLFSGVMKFIMPVEVMTQHTPFSGSFFHFIGVVEVLGGLGLILPWLLKIRPMLTPIAAAGLTIVMLGATVLTAMTMSVAAAIFPLVVGIACGFVMYGRSSRARQIGGVEA
jgi:uncharacterized membrane protein YphA (DoxX/SURF4 family)